MSSEQGPHEVGMRLSAIGASKRNAQVEYTKKVKEVAA